MDTYECGHMQADEANERAKKTRQAAKDIEDFLIEIQAFCHIYGVEAEKEMVRARLLTDLIRDSDSYAGDETIIWHRNYHLKAVLQKLRKLANALPGIEEKVRAAIPDLGNISD